MRLVHCLPLSLLLLSACARPEVVAFRSNPTPVTVAFQIPASLPGATALEKEYAAALRARLATRITVVPEGGIAPPQPVRITVSVYDPEGPRSMTPGQVGVVTGVAVGALGLVAGNRNAIFDGFFWGLFAGSHAYNRERRDARYLGYRPRNLSAEVAVTQDGVAQALYETSVSGADVIDSMDPLRGPERDDEIRIREEEAKAMARVVVFRLQEHFGWTAKPAPSFYRPGNALDPVLTPIPSPQPHLAPAEVASEPALPPKS